MKIIANGISNTKQLNEVMAFIENEFTTDRSTEDCVVNLSGEHGVYDITISVYYDDVQTIEIEVL